MKIKMLMAAGLTAALALSSCSSEEAKLAGAIAGTWNGTTTQMSHRKDKPDKKDRRDGDRNRMDAGEMTCTPTLTFVRTDGTNGGTIDISANYTLTRGVESVASATPVSATVNGSIKASGTWTAHDDDGGGCRHDFGLSELRAAHRCAERFSRLHALAGNIQHSGCGEADARGESDEDA